MVAIFGFVAAAASPDAHLRCILCCAPPIDGRTKAVDFAVQMHRLRARDAGADMAVDVVLIGDEMADVRCRGRAFLEFADPH